MIVYISIGNSDDKLSQERWAAFVQDVHDAVNDWSAAIHGAWHSEARSPYQNACWCAEFVGADAEPLKVTLASYARDYGQDSIAWAVAPSTEFLSPLVSGPSGE